MSSATRYPRRRGWRCTLVAIQEHMVLDDVHGVCGCQLLERLVAGVLDGRRRSHRSIQIAQHPMREGRADMTVPGRPPSTTYVAFTVGVIKTGNWKPWARIA